MTQNPGILNRHVLPKPPRVSSPPCACWETAATIRLLEGSTH